MLAGIREILIISTPQDLPNFEKLFGNGAQLGLDIKYAAQPSPDGLAQAFIIGEEFIGNDDVCLVLGDNIFYGAGLHKLLTDSVQTLQTEKKAVVFGYYVDDPQRYGVVSFDNHGDVLDIEEKPSNPKSNYAVVGLYFYPNSVVKHSKEVRPSDRGELEITSLNQIYLTSNLLKVQLMSRGFAWLDTGTHESLTEATEFVKAVEKRTGLKIACIEEIALNAHWIECEKVLNQVGNMKGDYYDYVKKICSNKIYASK
jgi:glucose-1-phosphate thymidylyltransferase